MSMFDGAEVVRVLKNLVFGRQESLAHVQPGKTFSKTHADKMVETAKVVSVSPDSFGIPHVHFQVSFWRPHRNFFDGGMRMLALRSFAERYTEQGTT